MIKVMSWFKIANPASIYYLYHLSIGGRGGPLQLYYCAQCSSMLPRRSTTPAALSPGWAPPGALSPSGASAPPRPCAKAAPTASSPRCPLTRNRDDMKKKNNATYSESESHIGHINVFSAHVRFLADLALLKTLLSVVMNVFLSGEQPWQTQHSQSAGSDFSATPWKRVSPFMTETNVICLLIMNIIAWYLHVEIQAAIEDMRTLTRHEGELRPGGMRVALCIPPPQKGFYDEFRDEQMGKFLSKFLLLWIKHIVSSC